ncbi:dynein axonemal assembly factor 1-like [Littorina saxatilis]|uniref:Dynein assembly factor 1, axonemal homolog n=1 Tax=Littorina saxatilis TaxID=31220 RepID=A0AAN9B3X0_9CAEN
MPSISLIEDSCPKPPSKPLIQEVGNGDSPKVQTSGPPSSTLLIEKAAETPKQTSQADEDASKAKKEAHKEEFKKKHPNILTKKFIKQHCKDLKLYCTPGLNDVLYLHYKGIYEIENLEEYTGLKCLWLEHNGIKVIENLDQQKAMRCLYLQHNLIDKLENLEPMEDLDTLNVSYNLLTNIENLACLTRLHSLYISHNQLVTYEDVEHLAQCHEIGILDLSHNKLKDPRILDIFAAMQNLRVLNIMGNPLIREINNYRKTVTVKLKDLQYLDDRPIFERDRACAEAWAEGGLDAEKLERKRWQEKENKKIMASVDALLQRRKQSEAHRIETDLNAKNAAEGITEKVEVDPETVDWLYGTYELKGAKSKEGEVTEGGDNQESVEKTRESVAAESQKLTEAEIEDLPIISKSDPGKDADASIFSSSTKSPKSNGSKMMITQMEDEGSENDEPEDLPDLEEVEIVPVTPSKGSFKPRIEVLDDSGSSDDDEDTMPVRSSLQQPSPKKSLIQEVTQPSATQPSPKTSLIEDITTMTFSEDTPTPRYVAEDAVSLNEVVLESVHDSNDAEEFMKNMSAMTEKGYSKSGVMDISKVGGMESVPEMDAREVREVMKGVGEGDADEEKDDGLGDLD